MLSPKCIVDIAEKLGIEPLKTYTWNRLERKYKNMGEPGNNFPHWRAMNYTSCGKDRYITEKELLNLIKKIIKKFEAEL